jgi:uncharacterized protein YllA (UPF0747 family)
MPPVLEGLRALDPTLLEAGTRAHSKMRYQLGRLQKRAANAELHKSEVVARHAAHLNTMLFPLKDLQERELAAVYFLARFGTGLLQDIYETVQVGCQGHHIIYL